MLLSQTTQSGRECHLFPFSAQDSGPAGRRVRRLSKQLIMFCRGGQGVCSACNSWGGSYCSGKPLKDLACLNIRSQNCSTLNFHVQLIRILNDLQRGNVPQSWALKPASVTAGVLFNYHDAVERPCHARIPARTVEASVLGSAVVETLCQHLLCASYVEPWNRHFSFTCA